MKAKHSHLWNELSSEERQRLMPHMIESQIMHIEQCKLKAVRAHKAHLKDLNEHINILKRELGRRCK